jgi:hypothetical protein
MTQTAWTDYLEAAGRHLSASRAAVIAGTAIPSSPPRPSGSIPEDLVHRADALALGYDLLALEVQTRMADIQRRRRSLLEPALPVARFVDQHA